jgi:MoaA/NifB/PqqE/SkfB family radical SAM enzyme
LSERQLFAFWQFNGDNHSYCNLKCPECYGRDGKNYLHYWNHNVEMWEKAWSRLNRDIYFVFSYGEALGSRGFYDCVEMIGRHPTWTLSIVTNLMLDPTKLLQSQLAREGRLSIMASWHPEGVEDRQKGWEIFKQHLLMVRSAGVPIHVLYCWHPNFIPWFPEYFRWLDAHDFRVTVRRYIGNVGGLSLPFFRRKFGGNNYPKDYTEAERGYLVANTCPKVQKYGLIPTSPYGKQCTAGKDMILVKQDGEVRLCADCENQGPKLGNLFNPDFKLNSEPCSCPSKICGGDYGMLHIIDPDFSANPEWLERDTFVSIVEGLKQTSPINYPNRKEMLQWLEQLEK